MQILGFLEVLPTHGAAVAAAERVRLPPVPGRRETDVGRREQQERGAIHPPFEKAVRQLLLGEFAHCVYWRAV